jgi:hypothetical protein
MEKIALLGLIGFFTLIGELLTSPIGVFLGISPNKLYSSTGNKGVKQ